MSHPRETAEYPVIVWVRLRIALPQQFLRNQTLELIDLCCIVASKALPVLYVNLGSLSKHLDQIQFLK